jgi:WD40 repeat protein
MKRIISIMVLSLVFSICFSQNNIFTLVGHNGNVNVLAFSKDGKYLLSGSQDAKIILWNVENNFSNEKVIAVSKSSITNIEFSPTGNEFTICTYKSFFTYKYPDLKKISRKKNAHTSFVKCANFSKNGEMIVTSSWRDNTLVLWRTKRLKKLKIFAESEWTDNAIFISDDKYIASINHGNTIKIWDVQSGNLIRTLAGHTDWVYGLFVTNDGKYLVSGSLDKTIKVWDLNSGKLFKSITAHTDGITSLSLSDDGKYFASTSLDKTTKIWSVENFSEIVTLSGHEGSVLSAKFSPNGKYIATSSSDKTVKIWDIQNLLK